MKKLPLAAALSCMSLLASPLSAQPPDDGKGRFAMSPIDGGFLRLDKETGAVALCTRKSEAWLCEPVEDKTRGSDDKFARLEAENKSLKDRVKSLEEALETNKQPNTAEGPPPPSPKMQLPTEEEVDKAMDYVERIFKKFKDRIDRMEKPQPEGKGAPL
jgi:hypothetical protein